MKRIAMVMAVGGGALWLLAPASVAVLSSCGDTTADAGTGGTGGGGGGGAGGGSGGGSGGGGGGVSADCFTGTPATNAQFLNACVDSSVEKVLKATTWRDAGVTLPALP
jgi:hypothetical protein